MLAPRTARVRREACVSHRARATLRQGWPASTDRQPNGALHNLTEGVATDEGDGTLTVSLGEVCARVEPGQPLVALVAGTSFPCWPRPKHRRTLRLLECSRLELTTAAERVSPWPVSSR